MKAILVTETNKNANKEFFKGNAIGNIVAKQLPLRYNGVKISNGGNYPSRTDLHLQDGFKDLVQPIFDSLTHKRTNKIIQHPEDEAKYTYDVIALTQEEIDTNLANFQDAEDEAEEQANEDAGIELIRRWRKRARRRIKKGQLTQNKNNKLRRMFSPIFIHLRNGDWDLANEDLNAPEFPTSTDNDINREITWLKERVNTYITETFNRKAK